MKKLSIVVLFSVSLCIMLCACRKNVEPTTPDPLSKEIIEESVTNNPSVTEDGTISKIDQIEATQVEEEIETDNTEIASESSAKDTDGADSTTRPTSAKQETEPEETRPKATEADTVPIETTAPPAQETIPPYMTDMG